MYHASKGDEKEDDVSYDDEVAITSFASSRGIKDKAKEFMDVYVEIVEKNEESESGSDSASESDNDFEDEEHVVQEVEVNMGYFNFPVEDASTGTDGNMIPVAPKVNLKKYYIEGQARQPFLERRCGRYNMLFLGVYVRELKGMYPRYYCQIDVRGFRECGRSCLVWMVHFMMRTVSRETNAGQHVGFLYNALFEKVVLHMLSTEKAFEGLNRFLLNIGAGHTSLVELIVTFLILLKERISSECIVDWNGVIIPDQLQCCRHSEDLGYATYKTCNMEGCLFQQGYQSWDRRTTSQVEQVMLGWSLEHTTSEGEKQLMWKLDHRLQGGTSQCCWSGNTSFTRWIHAILLDTKVNSKVLLGTSNAAGTQASQASKGGTSNAATQASTGSPLKRTKKSASRLTPEK
ncbi:hypothetical protein Tco_0861174 [Tanacetum coccineum]|uniref:Transposase n=1 Tax=Tanacetum coccineum TaxID=301880 RepID=A0ABQ5BJ88_9ASTR